MLKRLAGLLAMLVAASAGAEEWQSGNSPPVTLVRAALTSSLSRNGDPRRPLDSIKLGSNVYYFVEAKGFVPGRDYPIFVQVFDPSNREVDAHLLVGFPFPEPQKKISMSISGRTLSRPGLWTFRMSIGKDRRALQLLAETKIEVSPTGGSSAADEPLRFAPALLAALVGLFVYLAYNLFVFARVDAAAVPPPARRLHPALDPALLTLVAVNLAPLASVYYLDANAIDLLFIYWVETVVVGFYGILRIAFARGPGTSRSALFVVIPLFVLHFGAFCVIYGSMLFELFGHKSTLFLIDPRNRYGFAPGRELFEVVPFAFAAQGVLVLLAHGVSFVQNYLKGGEYLRATFAGEHQRPYRRLVAMHLALVIGTTATSAKDSPLAMLVLLVLLKTAVDVYSHIHAAPRTPLESP